MLARPLLGSIFLGQAATADSPEAPSGNVPGPGPLLDNARRVKAPPADEPARSIRVSADMTLLPVTVTDAYGCNVQGLEKQNFRAFENAEQRSIVAFSREDAPVSVRLIFDSNNSMRDKFHMGKGGRFPTLEVTYSG